MPPERWTMGLRRVAKGYFHHAATRLATPLRLTLACLFPKRAHIRVRVKQPKLVSRHHHPVCASRGMWCLSCPVCLHHAPVVPELNKIQRGQSNPMRAHSISPVAVRPNLLCLPDWTNSSKGIHVGSQALRSPACDALGETTTLGVNPA